MYRFLRQGHYITNCFQLFSHNWHLLEPTDITAIQKNMDQTSGWLTKHSFIKTIGSHIYLTAKQQKPDFQNTANDGSINNSFFFIFW